MSRLCFSVYRCAQVGIRDRTICSAITNFPLRLVSLFMAIVYKKARTSALWLKFSCSSLCGSFLLVACFYTRHSWVHLRQYVFIYNNKDKDNCIKRSYTDSSKKNNWRLTLFNMSLMIIKSSWFNYSIGKLKFLHTYFSSN